MFPTPSRRRARTAASAAVLAGSLLFATACGSGAEPPGAAPAAATQVTTPGTTPAPVPGVSPVATAPVATAPVATAPVATAPVATELPWPARGAAALSALQATADSGAQPWLLDPLDVAQAYAEAVHGWRTATVSTSGPDQVRVGNDGKAVLVTVGQPARSGHGGIWVVTGERPA